MENSTLPFVIESFFKEADPFIEQSNEIGSAYTISPLEKKSNLFLKRLVDFFLSSVLILGLLSWLIPVIGLLIRLDSKGPVFFLQKRNKKYAGIFTCIKFRTMINNEESDRLAAHANDHRITKIGKFLRRHHLDELPQLFNVWWGDMSLIGPRPHMVIENEKFETMVEEYFLRYKVKPGITGLAQILGYVGPVTEMESIQDRVKHDVYYIRYWSVALDMKIVCRTFFKMLGVK